MTRTATATRTVAVAPSATATSPILPTTTPSQSLRHRVRGRIQYYSAARAVPNVTVSLSGETQDSTQTSSTGDYGFDSVSPGTWEVAAEKSSDFGSGISPLDAAYVLQSIVNLRTLDPSQLLACDATGDGHLSALDATRILQFSVGTLPRLRWPIRADRTGLVPDPAATQDLSIVNRVAGGVATTADHARGRDRRARGQDFTPFCSATAPATGADRRRPRRGDAGAARVRLGRALLNGTHVSVPVIVRATGRFNALDLNVTYDAGRLTPGTVVLGHNMSSGFTSQAANGGVLRIAMASAEPIRRRLGMLMSLEFTRVDASTDPGTVAISAANVDEEPATIDASAASSRGDARAAAEWQSPCGHAPRPPCGAPKIGALARRATRRLPPLP
jgi:hypothetical protein